MPGKMTLVVLGVRGALAALTRASGMRASRPCSSVSRSRGDPGGIFLERDAREFGGFAEADDAGDIFRAGAEAALVVAAIEKLPQVACRLLTKSAPTPFGA